MVANTAPIYSLTPNVSVAVITAANTKSDGAGTIATDIFKAYTAGANGDWVSRVRFLPTATVAATATAATTARIFISSQTTGATTSANTFCIGEVSLPAVTADHSTNPTNYVEFTLNMAIPAGYTILVTNHVAPNANTAWVAVVMGGSY